MKNLSKLLILAILAPCALAQVPAPQVPITGNMGPGGVFPLLNSGTLHFTTDANHTMTYPEMSANVIRVVSNVTLTEQRNLVAPLTLGFQFTVQNATTGGQSIQVIGATGTGVIIANGTTVSVACDGTNYVQVGVSGVGTVTSFASPSASWPSWLVPSVSNPNTTPSLSVAASTIPVASGGTGTATPNLVAGPAISISGSWPNQTVTNTQPNIYYSVLAYGAVPDEQPVGYARFSTSSGSNVVNLTSITGPSYNFSGADVGKSFVCNNNASAPWTGGAPYVATITTVNNATQIVISTPAGNMNTSSPYCVWGTDNTPAFNACETAVAAMGGGGTCSEPSGRYLFATSPYYTFVGTALDDGGYATPAGGSGAVVTATVSGGAISGYTVSNGGSGYPINSQMQMTFTGGCPVVYAGPCGEAFAIANTNGSGVVSSITPVFNGFGFTSPPTVGVVALGGDGASATCTLSSGTCGTPSIGASGSGYTPSSSSLEIWAFNAVGGTCTEIGGRTGSRYVGKGNATTNSSGAVIGASWTTAPASCGSTTPTIAFGDVACWNAAMSQFNAQCTNLTPLLPTAIPVQVYTEPHVSWIGPTAGQNPAASNIGNWDGQTVDAVTPGTLLKQPAMFGGPMFFEDFYGLQNTNTFIGLLSSYDWDYSTISNMTFSGGLGFVSSSADTSAVIQDMNFQGYASWVNGGRWGHRTDDGTREAGGFFEPSYVNNFTVIPVGGGGYDSVAAAIDTWFADAFWRPEFTANAVDMPETCAFPQTANQRQTSSSLSSPIGQANETCYKGITGTGMVNLARDNNPIPAPVSITNFTVKKLWRPMFYGPINNNTLEFFSSEASTTLASDPYRAEAIQEGGIEFASTGAFSTVANISYYLSSGSAVLPIYNMDSATTTGTAGLPTGTAWWNLSGTSFTGTMPEQSLNIQNVIQNPNGELFSYNGYNSSSACFANWTNTAAQYAAGCLHGDGLFSHSFSAYGYTGTELMRFDPSDVQLLSTIFAPNIAASSGTNCLQIDTTGHITNTGSACGSGGGGGTSNVVFASLGSTALGITPCTLNTSLSAGGGTSATACLQAALDAGASPVCETLVLDGPALIDAAKVGSTNVVTGNIQTTALQIHACEHLTATGGGGWFLAAGSNVAMLGNDITGNPAATCEAGIEWDGGTYNGNLANQSKNELGSTSNGYVVGAFFGGTCGLQINDVTMLDPKTFCMLISNDTDTVLHNVTCKWTVQDFDANTDGPHFWGPAERITETGLVDINGGDDTIPINTGEGCSSRASSPSAWQIDRYPWSGGAIDSLTVDGVVSNSNAGVRWWYADPPAAGCVSTVSNIVINNYRDNGALGVAMIVGAGVTATGPISISNWQATGPHNDVNVPTTNCLNLSGIYSTAPINANGSTLCNSSTQINLTSPLLIGGSAGTATQTLNSQGAGLPPAWTNALSWVTPPTITSSPGALGQVALSGNVFYWYDGSRWQRVIADAAWIPTFNFVQGVEPFESATGTAIGTFVLNNTAGNLLTASVNLLINGGNAATCSVADTAGNIWLGTGYVQGSGGYVGSETFYVLNAVAGANTVTVTCTLAGSETWGIIAAYVQEWNPYGGTVTLDGFVSGNTANSCPTVSTAAVAPTLGDLLIEGGLTNGGRTMNMPGLTVTENPTFGWQDAFGWGYSTAGQYLSLTGNTSAYCTFSGAAFKSTH